MITVQGTFLKADGTPESGSLEFYSRGYVLESAGTTTVVPSMIKATLNSQGYVSVALPATDDPEWTPSGWTYTLVFKLSGDYSTMTVAIPYDTPNHILPVSKLVPVVNAPVTQQPSGPHEHSASDITSGVLSIARLPVGTTHSQVAFGDHLHDDRYYTETEVNTALAGKANTSSLATVATTGSYNDLADKPTIPTASVTSVAGKTGAVALNKTDVGLANVDNTADLAKPVSTATQTALNSKANISDLATVATTGSYNDLLDKPVGGSSEVSSVAGRTGDVVLTKADVGLANVDNTSDVSKPISTATQAALDAKANISSLADVATSGSYNDLEDTPTIDYPVDSVAGRTGDVVLTKSDVGLANVDNTSDLSKPISTATQTALDGKSNTGHTHTQAQITDLDFPVDSVAGKTGVVTLVKADVGLANVDNTSDANKPISSATQTALNGKANTSHTHTQSQITDLDFPVDSVAGKTGTVTLVKGDVGLGNVDNTSDLNKPISTATQTALDAKAATSTVTAISNRVTAVEDMTPVVMLWNGSAYVEASTARIYVGPNDPGTVPDGSIWIDTDA